MPSDAAPPHLSPPGLLAGAALALQPPAHAADPQPYHVTIAPTGDAAIDGALRDSSTLTALQTKRAGRPVRAGHAGAGRRRPAADGAAQLRLLRGQVRLTVDGRALDDPGLPDALAAKPADSTAAVAVAVDRGPLFHLRHVTVTARCRTADRAKLGIAPGDPAIASRVLAAQGNLLAALQATATRWPRSAPRTRWRRRPTGAGRDLPRRCRVRGWTSAPSPSTG